MTHTVFLETCMSRPGENNKPRLYEGAAHHVVDFDKVGSHIPQTATWAHHCNDWGIGKNNMVSICEADTLFCGPRLGWLLNASGVENIQFGVAAPTPLPAQPSQIGNRIAEIDQSVFCDKYDVQRALSTDSVIVDVRSASRYSGQEADPRPNVRAGHIPGSINIHYKRFCDSDRATQFASTDALKQCFDESGVDLSKPLIFTCGSGITACIGAWAATYCGATNVKVYDGSWAEWGADTRFQVATSFN